jgi:hypothetical protein
MNFSAQKASRKWPCEGLGRSTAAMVTIAAVLLMLGAQTGPAAARKYARNPFSDLFREERPRAPKPHRQQAVHSASQQVVHSASVPLPKPRPEDAPVAALEKPAAEKSATAKQPPGETAKPAEQAASLPPSPPPPSACRLALTEAIAIAPSIPDIKGPGECGGEDLVRLEAVVLPDKHRVSVKPAAIMRCAMATAVADWIRNDMAPLASGLGSVVTDLDNLDSFECRGRNGVVGAKLSEHGHANALDVHDLKLANGQMISFTDRTVARDVRENVLHSMCARFSTVLGPGSDGYHEDHIHLDVMERHNNYRICQWNVWDPLPQIAPLLPAQRPEEAPPRQIAAKSDAAKSDAAESDTEKSEAARPDTAKSGAGKSDAAAADTVKPESHEARSPTKRRRQNRRL